MAISLLIFCTILGLGLSACTIKATTDTTTDGTTEFVSSTTGESWWTEEGLVKQGHHTEAFVSVNYDNLLQNIAKGEGEYLVAFGKLLNVPFEDQKTFAHHLQQHYPHLSGINFSQDPIALNQFIHQVVGVKKHSSLPNL